MINCRNNGKCNILTELADIKPVYVPESWCKFQCGDSPEAKLKMLKSMGIVLKELPETLNEFQAKIASGEIKIPDNHKLKFNAGYGGCGKFKNIIKGFGLLAWQNVARLWGGKPPEWVMQRADICAACEFRTLLDVVEWAARGIDLRKITHLVGVFADADLPINHKPGEWQVAWCAKCKCCIAAAIHVAEKPCPEGKFGVYTEIKN